MVYLDIMRNNEEINMTYEECLEFCTKRMCVMGSFPDEIEAAAKKMFNVWKSYEKESKDSS